MLCCILPFSHLCVGARCNRLGLVQHFSTRLLPSLPWSMTLWWKVSRFTVEFAHSASSVDWHTFLEEDTVANFGVLPNSQEDEFRFEGHRWEASRTGLPRYGSSLAGRMPRNAAWRRRRNFQGCTLEWTFLQRAIANLMKHAMRRSARCSSFRSVHSGIARTGFPWHVVAGLGLRRLWQDQLFFLGFIVKVTPTSQILRTLVKGSTSTTLGRGFGALQCVSRCRRRDKYGYRLVQVWFFSDVIAEDGHTFSKYYFDAF